MSNDVRKQLAAWRKNITAAARENATPIQRRVVRTRRIKTTWTFEEISAQRLFHNAHHTCENGDYSPRSTSASETEMKKWSARGLNTWRDIPIRATDGAIASEEEFASLYPDLAGTYMELVQGVPEVWHKQLCSATALVTIPSENHATENGLIICPPLTVTTPRPYMLEGLLHLSLVPEQLFSGS